MISTLSPTLARAHPLAVLLSGHAGVAILTLARNIFAAHLIGAEQFGIAAGFAIVISAVEMTTTLGAQQLIIRETDGGSRRFQAWLQFVQLVRGIFGSAVIFLLAGPISAFLQVPEAANAFRMLALVPILMGFVHMDVWRFQRARRFAPSIFVQLVPAMLAFLVIWPLQPGLPDYRLLLLVTLVHALALVAMSHLLAERKYEARFLKSYVKRTLSFGAPLALNGALLLATFHGEKLIVGHVLGPTHLAILAMGFTLTLTPALIIGRSLQTYALPQLMASRNNPALARMQARQTIGLCVVAGGVLGLVLVPFGRLAAQMLGPEFAALLPIIPALAALHAIRVMKTGVSILSLARQDTLNTAIGNLPRLLALPVVYMQLLHGASLSAILWTAICAEAAGGAAASLRLYLRRNKT